MMVDTITGLKSKELHERREMHSSPAYGIKFWNMCPDTSPQNPLYILFFFCLSFHFSHFPSTLNDHVVKLTDSGIQYYGGGLTHI